MDKLTLQNISIALALLLMVGGMTLWADSAHAPAPAAEQNVPQQAVVSLSVAGLYSGKQVQITADETLLGVLQALNAGDPQLRLATKDYPGLGTLVVGMGGLTNGAGKKYWQYKVDGTMPQIGAGSYKLKGGERVEWIFGASQE